MAYAAASKSQKNRNFFVRAASSVWSFLVATAESNSQMRKIGELQELTDDDLAKMGLQRDDIPRHVLTGYL